MLTFLLSSGHRVSNRSRRANVSETYQMWFYRPKSQRKQAISLNIATGTTYATPRISTPAAVSEPESESSPVTRRSTSASGDMLHVQNTRDSLRGGLRYCWALLVSVSTLVPRSAISTRSASHATSVDRRFIAYIRNLQGTGTRER